MTGSSRGIGRTIALQLAEDGWNVALHCRSSEAAVKEVMKCCTERSAEAVAVSGDLANMDGIESISLQLREAGVHLRGLVNNAGVALPGSIRYIGPENWECSISLNQRAPVFHTSRLLSLDERASSIVNVSSAAGIRVSGSSLPYEASKAALIHVTRSMAMSLAPDIRVNAVALGYVYTNMTASFLDRGEIAERILKRTPLARLGRPEDVVNVVAFLMSDRAAFITGETLVVDGGITII